MAVGRGARRTESHGIGRVLGGGGDEAFQDGGGGGRAEAVGVGVVEVEGGGGEGRAIEVVGNLDPLPKGA